MARQINLERTYAYPPEAVWAAITDSEALSEWLMQTDFRPEVGHKFQFRTKPGPGFDGIVNGEVLSVEPPHKLVYTWQGGPMKKPTTVTWTLQSVQVDGKAGTHLAFQQSGFIGFGGLIAQMILTSGWRGLLKKDLVAYLDARRSGTALA